MDPKNSLHRPMLVELIAGASGPVTPVVWKTLRADRGLQTEQDFRSAFNCGGFHISRTADQLLSGGKFLCSGICPDFSAIAAVDLCILSVHDLGLDGNADYGQICAQIKSMGCILCCPGLSLRIRLQYGEQPLGESLLMAMDPIYDSFSRHQRILSVVHDDNGLWLCVQKINPVGGWPGGGRFICRPGQ